MNNSGKFKFNLFEPSQILELTNNREGEVKLGEVVQAGKPNEKAAFIILGIEESVGPIANFGLPGAENAFDTFLKRFLNMQSNRFLKGDNVCVLGKISGDYSGCNVNQARELVSELDALIEKTLLEYAHKNTTVIAIGGGHNNSLPIINAISKIHGCSLAVVNCDPHADCRVLEGRHSGNSFSYAFENGNLVDYAVLGLHKAFNSEYLLDFLEKNNCYHTFFEDYLMDANSFCDDVSYISSRLEQFHHVGLEIDLDAIKNMPSSALTPSGLSIEQIRFLIHKMTRGINISYLHLTEGAPISEIEQKIVGKTLAYFCWDFLNAKQ
jgi:formiminoglutamase